MKTGARELADSPLEWLKGRGESSDIVFSCRVRLARNLERFVFPWRADPATLNAIADTIRARIASDHSIKPLRSLVIDSLDPLARGILVERHLVSPALARGGPGREAAMDEKGILSVMVNEEDHIRIQAFLDGLRIHDAWKAAREADQSLEDLGYAFDGKSGFLTTCPTNMGTGLRASVMIHLPALSVLRKIGRIVADCGRIGLTVRGMYGEGSDSAGSLFQVSNQVTLGQSEEELLEKVYGVASGLVDKERSARTQLMDVKGSELEDKAWRAWGLLRYARIVDRRESLELLSISRMASEMDILPPVPAIIWNRLLLDIQQAHMQARADRPLGAEELDARRADVFRRLFEPLPETGAI
ncbi:MAG: protein arginine kinase [Thermovirgaceae bacterium]|nr:protein arginine kinase [Thermovirgaceae bacterium]